MFRTHHHRIPSVALRGVAGYRSSRLARSRFSIGWLKTILLAVLLGTFFLSANSFANCGGTSNVDVEKLVYGDLEPLRRGVSMQPLEWEWTEESGALGFQLVSRKAPCNSPECRKRSEPCSPIPNSVPTDAPQTSVGVCNATWSKSPNASVAKHEVSYLRFVRQWTEKPVPPPIIASIPKVT